MVFIIIRAPGECVPHHVGMELNQDVDIVKLNLRDNMIKTITKFPF